MVLDTQTNWSFRIGMKMTLECKQEMEPRTVRIRAVKMSRLSGVQMYG